MAALMALLVSVTLCGAEAPTPIERDVLTADQERLDALRRQDEIQRFMTASLRPSARPA
jgi:hypothetical protein